MVAHPSGERSSTRVGVFGWGVVAPRSPNIEAFAANLDSQESWLEPFNGFGPDNFLVGEPDFDFSDYEGWLAERFPPSRFQQLERKMGKPTLFAIGAFIQALGQNPGLEQALQDLGLATHIYVGTGLGDLPTIHDVTLELHRAQRRWNRFWSQPEHNTALREYLERGAPPEGLPADPRGIADDEERHEAQDRWWAFWMERSARLGEYLRGAREIESLSVGGDVESAKSAVIRRKRTLNRELQARWGAPDPPWQCVSANLLWNIHNTPASQISMIGRIHGMAFAPVAACSTFGCALKLAYDAIQRGEARAVVVGATDPAPHPLSVGSFSAARVLASDGEVSKPLTGLRGTHVSGGSVVWILGDYEHMTARGFKPLGMELLGVGVSADADHIITPSVKGPTLAIQQAFENTGVGFDEIGLWDLHATATPGDYLEVETLRKLLSDKVLVTARKGTFGHGMGVGGGWELLAQYLGYEMRKVFATQLSRDELNAEIARVHQSFVYDQSCAHPRGLAGKLSMGVGGINACVISRPW